MTGQWGACACLLSLGRCCFTCEGMLHLQAPGLSRDGEDGLPLVRIGVCGEPVGARPQAAPLTMVGSSCGYCLGFVTRVCVFRRFASLAPSTVL
jgi:hypothetical protein